MLNKICCFLGFTLRVTPNCNSLSSPKPYIGFFRYTLPMTLSARNQLEGTVEEVVLGSVMAHVTVRVGNNVIESVITRRSAEEMSLKKGDKVKAVIKSTEVMLLKD
jgi:molybdopterin-binding protein